MCVLLSLSDTQLGQTLFCDVLAEGVLERLGLKCDLYVRHGRVILGHAYELDRQVAVLACKTVERRVDQCAGDLASTVGAEVCKDYCVILLDGRTLGDNERLDELIGHALVIGCLDTLDSIRAEFALAVNHSSVSALEALPALVTVHCVVTAGYGCDAADAQLAHLILHLLDIASTRGRCGVAAVHEAMHADLGQAVALCQVEQGADVINMRVYAAVRHEAEDMQSRIKPLALIHSMQECLVLEERAVLNCLGNAGQFLVDDAASADVGVANLRVTHLTVGQTNIHAGRTDQGVGMCGEYLVEHRLLCHCDGVALGLLAIAEAVEDDECQRMLLKRLGLRGRFCRGCRSRCSNRCSLLRRGRLACSLGCHFFLLLHAVRKGQQIPVVPLHKCARGKHPHAEITDLQLQRWQRSQQTSGTRRRSGRRQRRAVPAALPRSSRS